MREVTESILELAKERQDIARRVARVKDANGIPIENLAVEEKLKRETSEYARKLGLEENFTEEMVDILLDHSKSAQREEIFKSRIASYLRGAGINSVFVIGSGRMGGWFARYFRAFSLQIGLFDKRKGFAKKRALEIGCDAAIRFDEASDYDLVLLAVPIGDIARELGRLQKLLIERRGGRCIAIIEVSSTKGWVLGGTNALSSVPLVSIHPLFGPSARNYELNSIIVVEKEGKNRGEFGLDLVKNLFPQFNVVSMSARAHDERMSILLSLPHILALVFRDVAARSKGGIRTPSYKAMDEFSKRVLGENSDVYFEIQSTNSFTPALFRDLRLSLDRMARYFEEGEKDAFRKAFFESVLEK